jgi:type II secretory pathway pseudopilin PulG
MTRSGHKGFTLMEVLVSFTVLLLATGMMVALFIPSMSLFRRQTGKSDSYRNCLMMMEKFQMSILNSQTETVTISLDGQAISWQEFVDTSQPFSGTTGDAQMSPDFGVFFYDPQTLNVYYTKKEGAGLGPNDPAILSLSDLAGARNISSKASRVQARNITQFYLSDKDGDVLILEPPITLSMTCEIDTKGQETNDTESFQLTASVTSRSRRW